MTGQAAEPETAPACPHPDERAQSRREHTENPQSGHREWSPCAHSPSQHGRGASTNRLELSVAALEKEREVKRAESTRRRKLVHAQSEPAVDLSARPGTRRADSLHLAGPRNNNWLSRNEMSGWTLQEGPLTVLFGISFSPHVGHQSRLMHPDSPFIILCTAISCCLLIYVLIVVQVEVGFLWHAELCEHELPAGLANFDVFVDCWFMFEIFITFFTGVHHDGFYLHDFGSVAKRYLFGWFWFDVITCIPESLIEASMRSWVCASKSVEASQHRREFGSEVPMMTKEERRVMQILNLMRPLRIFRLLRMIHFQDKVSRLLETLSNIPLFARIMNIGMRFVPECVWAMSKLIFSLAFVVHSCSCIFWLTKEASTSQEEISDFIEGYGLERDAPVLQRYALSIYYINTIFTTVGFGDVGPQNEAERFVTIFLMYVGVIVFGLLLSEVQEAVAEALSARVTPARSLLAPRPSYRNTTSRVILAIASSAGRNSTTGSSTSGRESKRCCSKCH